MSIWVKLNSIYWYFVILEALVLVRVHYQLKAIMPLHIIGALLVLEHQDRKEEINEKSAKYNLLPALNFFAQTHLRS